MYGSSYLVDLKYFLHYSFFLMFQILWVQCKVQSVVRQTIIWNLFSCDKRITMKNGSIVFYALSSRSKLVCHTDVNCVVHVKSKCRNLYPSHLQFYFDINSELRRVDVKPRSFLDCLSLNLQIQECSIISLTISWFLTCT